jgi:hypothetical protein
MNSRLAHGSADSFPQWSTGSRAFYERIFREVLANRGHNPDLVQLIQGSVSLSLSLSLSHLWLAA